jgi:hypothetical protein
MYAQAPTLSRRSISIVAIALHGLASRSLSFKTATAPIDHIDYA